MLGDDVADGEVGGYLVRVALEPTQLLGEHSLHRGAFRLGRRAVVQVRCVSGIERVAVVVYLHEVHGTAHGLLGAVGQHGAVLDGALHVEQEPRRVGGLIVVHEHGPLPKRPQALFQDDRNGGVEQRVSRTHEVSGHAAWHLHAFLLEADALVAAQHRIGDADAHVVAAHGKRYFQHLVAPVLAL